MKYLIAVVCLFSFVSVQAQKSKLPKTSPVEKGEGSNGVQTLNLKKGDSFKFSLIVDSKQSVSAMGMDQTTSTGGDIKILLSTKDVTPAVSTIELKYQSAKVSMKGMTMAGVPDTTFTLTNLESLNDIMTVIPNGTITNHKIKNSETSTMSDQLIKQIAGNSSVLRNIFIEFPDRPLTNGMEWKKSTHDTTLKGEKGSVVTNTIMKMTYSGTVDTLGFRCGKIQYKSEKVSISGTLSQMGMEMSVEGDGIIDGVSYFELSTGVPVAVRTVSQLDQRMSMSGQQEMVIPISVDMTTTLARVK